VKNIHDVIPDIYKRMINPVKINQDNLSTFLTNTTELLERYLEQEREQGNRANLRMSLIGRADRKIWMDINGPKKERELPFSMLMRFLYGSIVEELLLFLVKESGHSVTDEQKKVTLSGVVGHIDCKIDGEVVDVKSSSDYSFRKFQKGFDDGEDDFGYIGQISGYAEAEGKDKGYFLALNKSSGDIALLEVTDFDLINAAGRIKHIHSFLKDTENKPEVCKEPVPDGKSGNMQLAKACSFCEHKGDCWPTLRAFKYSNGVRYFTKIVREPKVDEINLVPAQALVN
jgi:hypothetical protein